MKEDFLKELGYLAFATRLKRLSDRMMHSGRAMYKSLDMDIEPNWYLIFKLLKRDGQLSVTEIADKLQFSHPSVISINNKMIQKGYLQTTKSATDGRKQLLELTPKAKEALPKFEEVWEAGIIGLDKIIGHTSMLTNISLLEELLDTENFMNRTLQELKKQPS